MLILRVTLLALQLETLGCAEFAAWLQAETCTVGDLLPLYAETGGLLGASLDGDRAPDSRLFDKALNLSLSKMDIWLLNAQALSPIPEGT